MKIIGENYFSTLVYFAPQNCRNNCSCNIYRKNNNMFLFCNRSVGQVTKNQSILSFIYSMLFIVNQTIELDIGSSFA